MSSTYLALNQPGSGSVEILSNKDWDACLTSLIPCCFAGQNGLPKFLTAADYNSDTTDTDVDSELLEPIDSEDSAQDD